VTLKTGTWETCSHIVGGLVDPGYLINISFTDKKPLGVKWVNVKVPTSKVVLGLSMKWYG